MRRTPVLAAAAGVVLVAGVTWKVHHDRVVADHRSQREAEQVVAGWLAAVQAGDGAAAARLATPTSADLARTLVARTPADLHATTTMTSGTSPVVRGRTPGAGWSERVALRGLGEVSWTGRLPLTRVAGHWRVPFTEAVLHPQLGPGQHLVRTRSLGTRGKVLMSDGTSMADDPVLAGSLRGRVAALTTAAEASAAGARFEVGDEVGVSGLQKGLQHTLAGTPSGAFATADARGRTVTTLRRFDGADGTDVTTTLDPRVEAAATAAMASLGGGPGGLAAVDVETGALLAVADSPRGGYQRSLLGTYPPGSTFKIVTSVAALSHGVGAGQVLDCAKTVAVGGRTFKNAEDEQLGAIGFARAFATSCNTWFVQVTDKVSADDLEQTARLFGFAATQQAAAGVLPVPSFGGSYPRPVSRAAAAGQAIGQDQVLASPLQMAQVGAAVASGTWHAPHLVAGGDVASHELPAAAVAAVRSFMAGVVARGGTAAGAGLPPGTIGKTGTAEHGSPDPKKTHAWFVGVRGRVAVAVVADDAGFGGEVAAPVVARFLRALG